MQLCTIIVSKIRRSITVGNFSDYWYFHLFFGRADTLRSLMEENYKEIRGYSLKYFWSDVLEDKELSILMDEKKHVKRRLKKLPAGPSSGLASLPSTGAEADDSSSDVDDNQKYSDEEVACRLKLEDDDKELFCVGRSYGTQDFVGQRVLQVRMEMLLNNVR